MIFNRCKDHAHMFFVLFCFVFILSDCFSCPAGGNRTLWSVTCSQPQCWLTLIIFLLLTYYSRSSVSALICVQAGKLVGILTCRTEVVNLHTTPCDQVMKLATSFAFCCHSWLLLCALCVGVSVLRELLHKNKHTVTETERRWRFPFT